MDRDSLYAAEMLDSILLCAGALRAAERAVLRAYLDKLDATDALGLPLCDAERRAVEQAAAADRDQLELWKLRDDRALRAD